MMTFLETSLSFWQNFKKNPTLYLDWEDRVMYHQISGFARAYISGMEDVTGIPYYSKVRYWFLVKYQWELDGVWFDLIYSYRCKNNEEKSIRMIFKEIAMFLKAEKSMLREFADTIFDVELLSSTQNLHRTSQQRYDNLLLHFSRFQIAPFAFVIHRDNPEDKYMTILGYLVGFLYGMSHFSTINYAENFKRWLFEKYAIVKDVSWPRVFLEILSPDDKNKAASMASEEVLLFFKNEVKTLP